MITLEVNGVNYTGFTEISVTKSLTDFCGKFSFVTVWDEQRHFPIKIGQRCKIRVENTVIINGFIEQLNITYDSTSHVINVIGRDKTADIVDSTLAEDIEFTAPYTLENIAKKVLNKLNIKNITVSSNVPLSPFQKGELESGEIGIKAFDLIEKYARKKHVLATTTGDGNILFRRSDLKNKYKTILSLDEITQLTIKSANVTYDNSKRYHTYIVRSQTNDSVVYFDVDTAVNVPKKLIYDNEIRNSRIYNFIAEQALLGEEQAKTRAQWEANFRRSQAFTYNCTVQGFIPVNDKIIWQPAYFVQVIDEFSNINSTLLIEQVQYNFSLSLGSQSVLKLVTADAFTLEVERPEKKQNEEPQGPVYFDKQEQE